MTIDEAIKHCLEVADKNEIDSITYKNCKEIKTNMYEKLLAEKVENDCKECAADHRQLADWLKELKVQRGKIADICSILAAYYGCPCDYSPQDEIMVERGNCEDCGKVSNAECWSRFFETEIQLDREGIQDNTNKMYAEIKELREQIQKAKAMILDYSFTVEVMCNRIKNTMGCENCTYCNEETYECEVGAYISRTRAFAKGGRESESNQL